MKTIYLEAYGLFKLDKSHPYIKFCECYSDIYKGYRRSYIEGNNDLYLLL